MKKSSKALILISMDFFSGSEKLRSLSEEMTEMGVILSASSVYKRNLNQQTDDLNSELVMVVKIETTKTEMDLFQFFDLRKYQKGRFQMGRVETFLLLAYEQKMRLVPEQNLPHPILREDSLVLRCAAEAWGDYQHPVLRQSLAEIVGSAADLPSVEFFSQFVISRGSFQGQETR